MSVGSDQHGRGSSDLAKDRELPHASMLGVDQPDSIRPPDCIDFTIATSVQHPDTGDTIAGVPLAEVADLMHRGAVGGVRQDIPIWEGLRHIDHPRLVKGDGPIPRLRHWARQFHH